MIIKLIPSNFHTTERVSVFFISFAIAYESRYIFHCDNKCCFNAFQIFNF